MSRLGNRVRKLERGDGSGEGYSVSAFPVDDEGNPVPPRPAEELERLGLLHLWQRCPAGNDAGLNGEDWEALHGR